MGKEDSGRLLAKVAKFVRNPLKDWSELDDNDAAAAEGGYSREMLKEMIERRQRNDFVRRREFDMLRKLRQREAAGASAEGVAAVSSSFDGGATGKTEGRALTLKKIDEIEEQMSQQWRKGRPPDGAAPATGAEPAASDEPAAVAGPAGQGPDQRARAYADTVPGVAPPGDGQARTQPSEAGMSARPAEAAEPVGAPPVGLEDAAIRFAQGDDAGAEAVLLQMTSADSPEADDPEVWRTLFDFYRATGDAEKFSATSTRYAQRLRRPGPEWVSLRQLAHDAQARRAETAPVQPMPPAAGRVADWTSPARLTRESLAELTRSLALAGPVWTMDWRALTGIEPDAAPPLRALFNHWAESPVQLRFQGTARLLEVLAQATPIANRNIDVVWWQLRLAVLRCVHESDQYELTALNYCITYEVSPPPWADPRGTFAAAAAPEGAPLSASVSPGGPALVGTLAGDCQAELRRLESDLAGAHAPAVACGALVRLDLEAARTLIDWVARQEALGRRVEFVDAHRLVAIFFQVVGITDHAGVSARGK